LDVKRVLLFAAARVPQTEIWESALIQCRKSSVDVMLDHRTQISPLEHRRPSSEHEQIERPELQVAFAAKE
jgi:hypothetical protein